MKKQLDSYSTYNEKYYQVFFDTLDELGMYIDDVITADYSEDADKIMRKKYNIKEGTLSYIKEVKRTW